MLMNCVWYQSREQQTLFVMKLVRKTYLSRLYSQTPWLLEQFRAGWLTLSIFIRNKKKYGPNNLYVQCISNALEKNWFQELCEKTSSKETALRNRRCHAKRTGVSPDSCFISSSRVVRAPEPHGEMKCCRQTSLIPRLAGAGDDTV